MSRGWRNNEERLFGYLMQVDNHNNIRKCNTQNYTHYHGFVPLKKTHPMTGRDQSRADC